VVGLLLLAVPTAPVAAVGLAIALSLGWGWPTAMVVVMMQLWRTNAARTAGLLSIGTSLGASLGPVAFGAVAGNRSYSLAWLVTACLSAAAVGWFLLGQRRLQRWRRLDNAYRVYDDDGLGTRSERIVDEPDKERAGPRWLPRQPHRLPPRRSRG
jgi:MFS family permease